MMKKILFLFFITFSLFAFGQKTTVNIDVTVKSMTNGKKEAGVTTTVYQGSKVVESSVTTRNGRVNLTVPDGAEYKVEFKKAGMVTRYFNLNAKGIDLELIQDNESPFVYCEVSLFEEIPGVDFSYVTNNPFTVFKFDGKSSNLAFDHGMADKMQVKINQILEEAKRQGQHNEIQYQAKMKQGEDFANQKKYQDAIASFEQALMFKRADKVAIKRIDDMEKLLTSEQANIVSGQALDTEFNELVKAANALRDAKKYQDAIDKYEEALTKKRGDMYCIDEIERLEKIIKDEKDAKANEEKYKLAMQVGNTMMGQKSYETALKKFEEALLAKPNDPTATAKKKEAEKFLNDQKDALAKKAQYEKLIAEADQLYSDEIWEQSKAKYEEALQLEGASTYAKARIEDIKAKLKAIQEAKEKEAKINQLLADGNNLFSQSKWQESKDKYIEVQKLDAQNEIAKSQIELINQKLKDEKDAAELEKQFKDLVAKGDNAFTGKKFEDALKLYEQAIALKVESSVQTKIDQTKAEIEKLANATKTKEMYEAAIKEADKLFNANDLTSARAKYVDASNLDDSQKYPKDQIEKIDKKIADEQQKQQQEEAFNELMAMGESLMQAESYLEAKSKFEEAKRLNSNSPLPAQKIKEIDDILAANKAQQELAQQIQSLLANADNLFNDKKYQEAITAYGEVLKKDAQNEKAKSQLQLAKELLEKQKADAEALQAQQEAEKAQAERLAKYAEFLKQGDDLVATKRYQDAIAKYESAKSFTDDASEINAKIANTQKLIQEQQEQENLAEVEKQYLAAFNEGVQFQKESKYQEAITAYQKAKNIDPNHTEPDMKIAEVNQLIAELEEKKLNQEKLQQEIATLISEGDALVSSEQYQEAIQKFEKARALDETNSVIPTKIAAAKKLLEQQLAQKSAAEKDAQYQAFYSKGTELMSQQKYDEAIEQLNQAIAVDARQEAKDKLQKAKELKEQLEAQKSAEQLTQRYSAFIEEGESFLSANRLEEALTAFKNASELMKEEEYPKKKIAEINDLIEAKKLEQDAQKRMEEYQALLLKGDQSFSSQEYAEALTSYKAAAAINKTEEVNEKIALTQQKAKELEEQLLTKQYQELMALAATNEAADNLESALENYKKASRIKGEEQLPKTKIAEIEKILQERQGQKLVDENYRLAMQEADEAFAKEDYTKAIEKYNLALSFKKDEQRPKDQIAIAMQKYEEISRRDEDIQFEKILQFAQQKIDERDFEKALDLIERAEDNRPNEPRLIKLKNEVKEQIEIGKQYQEKITLADEQFAQNNYKEAKTLYEAAKTLIPTKAYPVNKITEINDILSQKEGQQQKETEFLALLKQAEKEKSKEKYEDALNIAGQAKNLLPSDERAKTLIDELEQLILAENEAKSKSQLNTQFDKLVAQADQLFESNKWTKAKTIYAQALALKKDNSYVKTQIDRCSQALAEKELNQSRYLALVATADQDFKSGNLQKAQEGYELALTYDGSQQYPKDRIRTIKHALAEQKRKEVKGLQALGDEQIDISLAEGMALLAAAEEARKNNKGQLIKEKRNIAVERNDSIHAVTKDFVANINDSLALTKEGNVQDLTEYYDNQFSKDKLMKGIDKDQNDWYNLIDGYTYTDQLEGKRKLDIIDGQVVEKHREYIDHNFDLVDSMRYVGEEIGKLYDNNTLSDYDEIMKAKRKIRGEEELQVEFALDDVEEHWGVVHLAKGERENAVQENYRQKTVHNEKIDNATDLIAYSDELKRENGKIQEKTHEFLLDEVKGIRMDAIDKENQSYNDVYTKQMKAKVMVKNVETDEYNANLAYLEDKSLDIDRSRVRLNEASHKYSQDEMSDDELREEARLLLKGAEQHQTDQNYTERKKSNIKTDHIKNVAKNEETLQISKKIDKKDELYDTRSDLKKLEYAEVKFPPKVANSIGKNYPEGVSQETFKENGPDGLPVAIITRRIVVKNGYGDVYTRTQKYGSITYSKNGEPCTEMIWRNGTTDPSLEKHY